MGMFDFLRRETRDIRTSDPGLAEFFLGRGMGSGVNVDAALSNLSVAAACVRLLSELMASTSLHVHRRGTDGARNRADDLSLYDVLHSVANGTQSAFEFRELLCRDVLTHGNAYAVIERGSDGQIIALTRLDPFTVGVEKLASGRLRYKVNAATYLQDDVLHVRGPSTDGIMGRSPITISRGSFALALTQAGTAAKVAENAVQSSGMLSFAQKVGPDQRTTIKDAITAFTGTGERAGSVMLLDGDPKFTPFTQNQIDMETLASRKLSNEDTCRAFGVPPTCVGITDKATYSNVEQEARALVQNALGPLASRVEAAMMRCLLSPEERRSLYIEHDLSAILRGDVASRFEAYRVAREIGVFSANDVRRKENEPPVPGGYGYNQPANWVPLGTAPTPQGGAF